MLWVIITTLCTVVPAFALVQVSVEPLIGYERVQKLVPTQHTNDHLAYGARATVGVLLVSGEVEYLRSEDKESFSDLGLSIKDTADKAKVGLRSGLRLGRLFSVHARMGAQATRKRHEETNNGETSTTNEPIKYHPYGGAGFRIRLGSRFSFTADVAVVFVSFPKIDRNEYQTTAGFVVHLP